MKNANKVKRQIRRASDESAHVTRGNVFVDLGFSPEEALSLKIKTDCHSALMAIVKKFAYTQRDLQKILDQPQPRVSELLNGKISKLSIEKILEYLGRLGAKPVFRVALKEVPRIKAETSLKVAS